MSFTSYANLQIAVAQRIERTGDTVVTDILPDSIALCESRINKVPDLRVREMETEATVTLTSGSGNLPSDFLAMKDVVINTSGLVGLDYTPPGTYKREISTFTGTDNGYPFYTIIGSTIRSVASTTLTVTYYAKVPSLTVTDPNWLLTKAPEVYLYGTILELAMALEWDSTDKWGTLFSAAVQGLISSETFNRGGAFVQRMAGPSP